jgi:hypothetical protein
MSVDERLYFPGAAGQSGTPRADVAALIGVTAVLRATAPT